jgi:CRISPR-associated protein Csd2
VEPVAVESVQITKSVNSETTADGEKSSDTMGMKHRVAGKAVYVTYGSVSPQLAAKTGFSERDAEAVKAAISTLFEADESAARPSGSMEIVALVWFKHNSKCGQYSSAKVHRAVKVDKDGKVTIDKEAIIGLAFEAIEG